MDIDKVPLIGKLNRSMNAIVVNFALLAMVFLILAVLILVFPKVLEVFVSALLIVCAIIFINIAVHIYSYKNKYTKWFE